MRLRALIGPTILVVVLGAAPALGQALPDLPGMDVANKTVGGRSGATLPGGPRGARPAGAVNTGDRTRDLGPGTGALPTSQTPTGNQSNLPTTDVQPTSATRPATAADDALPSTGAAIAGFGLLGLALVSGGRLILELVPRR